MVRQMRFLIKFHIQSKIWKLCNWKKLQRLLFIRQMESNRGMMQSHWCLSTQKFRTIKSIDPHLQGLEEELLLRGIKYEIITDGQANAILNQISHPEQNMEVVQLEKAPKIAVYTPNGKQPWDDAVTLVLEYAEIPYDKIYDPEIIQGKLHEYDWLHLHHEDFTGQYGKF